ncbi:GTPase family protein [Larkinella insperata]|uniref:GTPase family protein n=1 Tax=Larkinella insperata TaxID=332158 RepID=A0ABW3QKI4_9BACT|nr:GTPase [Larkinella insperata]
MSQPLQSQLSEVLQKLESLLERVPEAVAKEVRQQIREFRQILVDTRPPRFALVGRRGSGKSSLINAIFGQKIAQVGHEKAQTGEATWWPYSGELGSIDILDTRGLQEGSRPDEADAASSPIESILTALREKAPDIILFLIKATEADAGIDHDLEALKTISQTVEKVHNYRPPVMVVATHCDTLEPKNVRLHKPEEEDPDDLQEKRERVAVIENHLQAKFEADSYLKESLITVLGVSSYQSWKNDVLRSDERWRIDTLLDYLFNELPKEGKLAFARLSQIQTLQESIANRLTQIVAAICGGIAAVPIPFGDIVPITALQVALISAIAYVAGRQLSQETAKEFLTAIGATISAGLMLREVARASIKFLFPGGGSVISAGIASSATLGIGKAATAYFIQNLSIEKARQIFEGERKKAKA